MRKPRLVRRGVKSRYHCTSRTVGAQFLFGDREREVFCQRLRRLADFCCLSLLSYSCLSNHFHVMVEVPAKLRIKDLQLFRLLRAFYGAKHPKTLEFAQALKSEHQAKLATLRALYLARLGDLSVFMKELKEGFSKWFNHVHERPGTLWAERFGSVLCSVQATIWVAAYIDLNAVRAGLARDPAHYRFCSYADALARDGPARAGLQQILPGKDFAEQMAHYRTVLFGEGSVGRKSGQAVLEPKAVWKVFQAAGKLTSSQMLLLKVRYFTEGIALGSAEFIGQILEQHCQGLRQKRQRASWPIIGTDWDGLHTLKKIKNAFTQPKSA
jgi:REP element-mobilizing transposase RayT